MALRVQISMLANRCWHSPSGSCNIQEPPLKTYLALGAKLVLIISLQIPCHLADPPMEKGLSAKVAPVAIPFQF